MVSVVSFMVWSPSLPVPLTCGSLVLAIAADCNFMGTEFCGATVFFIQAEFSGATVKFNDASFSRGTVDFSHAGDWSHAPTFPWEDTDTPPPDVKLPEKEDQSQAGPS